MEVVVSVEAMIGVIEIVPVEWVTIEVVPVIEVVSVVVACMSVHYYEC